MLKLGGLTSLKKCFCTLSTPNYILKHQKERALISVAGEEASAYLQGLITNDIQHLSNDCTSQYALFLNSKGRVLYDSIIYRIDNKTYFVECDFSAVNNLEKHLKIYKLRRKVEVKYLKNYQIYALFANENYEEVLKNRGSLTSDKSTLNPSFSNVNNCSDLKLFRDPRVSQLGYRIISQSDNDIQPKLSDLLKLDLDIKDNISFRKYRYSLGVGEGTTDLPSGNCFPLESNCDYLHGISFHKGCYIGQELTARTYHTGVTRKRLMPVYFSKALKEMPLDDSIIHGKVKLGKLRGIEENIGLALLRIDLISNIQNLTIAGTEAVVGKPFWWPVEAPKDKLSLKR